MTYWVSYDLDKPGQDYTELIAAIRKLGGKRILLSDWLLKSSYTAAQLRDHLSTFVDSNDRIFVAALTGEAAWRNVMAGNEAVKNVFAT